MHRTLQRLFDSFRAARGALEPLFSPTKPTMHMQKEVRHFLMPALSHPRRRHVTEKLNPSQRRSLFRTNVSLLLGEARRRGNAQVAAAALDVALSEVNTATMAQELEPAWVKDAVAACQDATALRLVAAVLRRHEQAMLASGSVSGPSGFLLSAAFGRSNANGENGLRLGDSAWEEEEEGDAWAMERRIETSQSLVPGNASSAAHVDGALTAYDAAEREVAVVSALVQPPSLNDLATTGGGSGDGSVFVSAEARAAASLRRLQRQHRDLIAGPNVSFTRYFLHQGLVRDESELMALYQALRSRPADVTFRVVGGGRSGGDRARPSAPNPLRSPLAEAAHSLLHRRPGLHRISWLPASMGAYSLDTRTHLSTDTVQANRTLLRSLAREGLIAYQSISSMLPVLFLDPKPGEVVLDLCASPGNKTTLLLDMMHGAESGAGMGNGCVVANEANRSRLRELQDRLRDVSPEIAVTQGPGQAFGCVHLPESNEGDTQESNAHNNGSFADHGVDELYDAVLVDTPCSGEGRMGRDAMSWRLWHPGRGLEFFPLQLQLLRQALRLCKVGGRVVYATCTLNPLENEAVVAAVLRELGDAVELVPPPPLSSQRTPTEQSTSVGYKEEEGEEITALPVLRLSPGLRRWDVPSGAGGFLNTPAEAYAQGESHNRVRPEMFAQESGSGADVGEALHRCCRRVMPHLNGGTDGFFVCVLRKVRPLLNTHQMLTASSRSPQLQAMPSSLMVSLAGGSNLLRDDGLVRLPPTNALVQKALSGFFSSVRAATLSAGLPRTTPVGATQAALREGRCTSVQQFLDSCGWAALWKEGEGLRLLSQSTVNVLRRHATQANPDAAAVTSLLETGVLVMDAADTLTERGAILLSPCASCRVVPLPLPYAQLLLANRQIDVAGATRLLPDFMQDAEESLRPHKTLARHTGRTASESGENGSPAWCVTALGALQNGTAGNAIVRVDFSSTGSLTGLSNSANSTTSAEGPAWTAPMASWSWPVRVEVLHPWSGPADLQQGLVRLHLLLPAASRSRTLALIGRLQGHHHRVGHTQQRRQQMQLREGAVHNPAHVMDPKELHGTPMRASQQHRLLFKTVQGSTSVAGLESSETARETSSVATAAASPSTVFEL